MINTPPSADKILLTIESICNQVLRGPQIIRLNAVSKMLKFQDFVRIGTSIFRNFQKLSGPQNQPFEQPKIVWIKETASL